MPKTFKRIISFEIEGEIYDNSTSAESILRNYNWNCKSENNHISVTGNHKDKRGRITSIIKKGRITKSNQSDSDYFII